MTSASPKSPKSSFNGSSAPVRSRGNEKTPSPLSLRLTKEERAVLEREAGSKPLSTYVRSRLFGDKAAPRRTRRQPIADHQALARVLSALGRSNLAQNFDALGWAVKDGTVRLNANGERALEQACADIAAMRRDLVSALGLKPKG